jgi:rRNA maturation protein Rpf1
LGVSPVIGFTTGRQTNQRLNSLLKDLVHSIPTARVVRRGKSSLSDLGSRLFEERLEYVTILQRWHGGPGRIDFFKVEGQGLAHVAPSVLLKAVKLSREYPHSGKHIAEAVTYEASVSGPTRRFVQRMSMVLGLAESNLPTRPEINSTLHVSDKADGSIIVALTSSPAHREVGPKLQISRLVWDLHD